MKIFPHLKVSSLFIETLYNLFSPTRTSENPNYAVIIQSSHSFWASNEVLKILTFHKSTYFLCPVKLSSSVDSKFFITNSFCCCLYKIILFDFRALAIATGTESFVFTSLMSWSPTYFSEQFPTGKVF